MGRQGEALGTGYTLEYNNFAGFLYIARVVIVHAYIILDTEKAI